jgi:hypothetical protein
MDRAAFLAITYGLFGCNGAGPVVAGSMVEIPTQPPAPPAAPVVREVPDAAVEASVAEKKPEEEEEEDTETVARSTCGWVDPATVTRPSAACADDKGTVPACAPMKTCSGVTFPKMKCEAFRKYFKPKVAARALECLAKLSDKQVCDACNSYRCGDLALKTACPDSSADATCVQITRSCRAISMADCRAYLDGMNAAGRAKIAGCLSGAPGCGFGIFSCAEGLF